MEKKLCTHNQILVMLLGYVKMLFEVLHHQVVRQYTNIVFKTPILHYFNIRTKEGKLVTKLAYIIGHF